MTSTQLSKKTEALSTAENLNTPVKPNLFQYATSELSQDAFLCWLFEHLQLKTNDVAYKVAEKLLEKIIDRSGVQNPDLFLERLLDSSLKIDRQVYNIDILLTFELDDAEKVHVIIEDKTHSGESRKNQLEHYQQKLKTKEASMIIPVLFKTGYVTEKVKRNFAERHIIFIGYEDIYDIFLPFVSQLLTDIILHSWWQHFHENYYQVVKGSENFTIDDTMTLAQWSNIVKEKNYIHRVVFEKLVHYLFQDIDPSILTTTFPFQGKGHIDWHYQMRKENWKSKSKQFEVNVYFIWDTYNFSVVVKTAPLPYKREKDLSDTEKQAYTNIRDYIKNELRKNMQSNWKIRNYYLQVAYLDIQKDLSLKQLKEKLEVEITKISSQIDRILV